MNAKSAAGPLATARLLAATLMAALVIVGIALSLVVESGSTSNAQAQPLWPYVATVLVGAVAALVVQFLGYRVAAVPPGLSAAQSRAQGLAAFTQSMVIRFAFSESVAVVSIALTFIAQPRSVQTYYLGGAISLLLMAYHVWPGQSVVARVQRSLDRDGGSSELAEALAG